MLERTTDKLENLLANNDRGRAALYHIAAYLLVDSTERGDLDRDTVIWAVDHLLSAANVRELDV